MDHRSTRVRSCGPQASARCAVARLSPRARQRQRVVGQPFTVELMAEITGQDGAQWLAVISEAIAADVLQPSGAGSYEFAHALFRDAAYEELGEAARTALHERTGEALMNGRFDECERYLEYASRLGQRAGSANAALMCGLQRWFLLMESGRAAEGLDALHQVAGSLPEPATAPRVSLALGLAASGRIDDASAHLDALSVEELTAVHQDSEWLPMLGELSEAVAMVGGHPLAEWTYEVRSRIGSCSPSRGWAQSSSAPSNTTWACWPIAWTGATLRRHTSGRRWLPTGGWGRGCWSPARNERRLSWRRPPVTPGLDRSRRGRTSFGPKGSTGLLRIVAESHRSAT